ncbi:uncharacterized protein LOC107369415 [Tetranychus urticae]|uniref:Uncharacterized protein n=1 Tax=Tetranychus urticae TaxID=32264 RepID=T1L1L3_TETUR|nr:uncharacterized protein LOC107369415 [Tetranychus urticae]
MKSILCVALIALAISSSFAVKIKGSCPKPEQPKVDYWYFSNFINDWKVLGRTEETEPNSVWNNLEIRHLYPGKVVMIEWGDARDTHVRSQWDKYMDMIIGDFGGESYYDVHDYEFDPYSFNYTTSDGHPGQIWMPYYGRPKYAEAVLASCVKIDESTVDVKAWFVSMSTGATPSDEVKNIMKSLTGQKYLEVCQGSFC